MKTALAVILILSASPGPGRAESGGAGRLKACNAGTFSLAYELAREGNRVVTRRVSVRVRNDARYFDRPFLRLREHEAMHQRINEASAKRMERELRAWSTPATDLKTAEALLRRDFREKLKTVKALHREWDANSVFVDPPPKVAGPGANGPAVPRAAENRRAPREPARHPAPSVND